MKKETLTSIGTDFQIGDWLVQPALNRVTGPSGEHVLEPKVMEVLVSLSRRPGVLTTRQELLSSVWHDVVVGEELLTRAVSELRKILGDDPRQPRYIETIYKKGYRVVAEVTVAPGARLGSGPSARFRSWWPILTAAAVTVTVIVWTKYSPTPEPPSLTVVRTVMLTSFPGREVQPAVSPGGERVAFAWAGPDGPGPSDIWLTQRDSSSPLRLTDDPAMDKLPCWSGDGTSIAFARVSRDGCAVLSVPAIGGPTRVLTGCTHALVGLDWSADGRWLALADRLPDDSGRRGVFLVDLTTGERTILTSHDDPRLLDTSPRFSPDGREVGVRRRLGEATYEVFAVAVADGSSRQLTFTGQDNGGFDWLDGGNRLVVASNRGGEFGLWIQDLQSPQLDFLGLEGAFLPSAAAHAPVIVVERRRWDSDIWRVDLSGGTEPTLWTGSTRADLDPSFSPDGRRVAFVSARSGGHELWMAATDGDEAVRLTFFNRPGPAWRPTVQHPRWLPSGDRLVVAARLDEHFDLYVVGVKASPPEQLTQGGADDLAPVWCGDQVFFASDRAGGWHLWRRSPGGPEVQVSVDPILPSVDCVGGDQVIVSRGINGLWSVDARTGRERQLLAEPTPGGWVGGAGAVWLLAGNELRRLNPDTGEIRTWTIEGDPSPSGSAVADAGVSVGPGGTVVLAARSRINESDIELIETAAR